MSSLKFFQTEPPYSRKPFSMSSYWMKNLFSLSNRNLILLNSWILFSVHFIIFCLHIFKSNDFILFLPYPDLSPQPCLQLSRFIPLQRWPLLGGPRRSSLRLSITGDLCSSLSTALKLRLSFTLTLTLPTYPLAFMTDGVMETPRKSAEDRRGTRSRREWWRRKAAGKNSKWQEVTWIRAGGFQRVHNSKVQKRRRKGYIINSRKEDRCFYSSFLHPS